MERVDGIFPVLETISGLYRVILSNLVGFGRVFAVFELVLSLFLLILNLFFVGFGLAFVHLGP